MPINDPQLDERLSLAIELAQQAGQIITDVAATGLSKSRKADRSWVTNADHQSDRFIHQRLAAAFPQDGILTEESGRHGPTDAPLTWVVDPLDGTKAFVQQKPGFSVMIGLLDGAQPRLGVVFDPLEGWLYHATAGYGAHARGPGETDSSPQHISDRTNPEQLRLTTSPGIDGQLLQKITSEVTQGGQVLINSVGIKVGLLIRQQADVYYSYHGLSYWDTVAPLVIAREAGAQGVLLDGQPFAYDLSDPQGGHSGPSVVARADLLDQLQQQLAAIVSKG